MSAYCNFIDLKPNVVGWGDSIKENSVVCIELDLNSKKKGKRIVHFIIDDKQQEYYFYNVPSSVKPGVCCFFSLFCSITSSYLDNY